MAKFTPQTASAAGSKGGKKTVELYGTQHMASIGKLGFQATVDKHWHGDRTRYLTYLQVLGLIATDPCPANGAWQRPIPTPDEP